MGEMAAAPLPVAVHAMIDERHFVGTLSPDMSLRDSPGSAEPSAVSRISSGSSIAGIVDAIVSALTHTPYISALDGAQRLVLLCRGPGFPRLLSQQEAVAQRMATEFTSALGGTPRAHLTGRLSASARGFSGECDRVSTPRRGGCTITPAAVQSASAAGWCCLPLQPPTNTSQTIVNVDVVSDDGAMTVVAPSSEKSARPVGYTLLLPAAFVVDNNSATESTYSATSTESVAGFGVSREGYTAPSHQRASRWEDALKRAVLIPRDDVMLYAAKRTNPPRPPIACVTVIQLDRVNRGVPIIRAAKPAVRWWRRLIPARAIKGYTAGAASAAPPLEIDDGSDSYYGTLASMLISCGVLVDVVHADAWSDSPSAPVAALLKVIARDRPADHLALIQKLDAAAPSWLIPAARVRPALILRTSADASAYAVLRLSSRWHAEGIAFVASRLQPTAHAVVRGDTARSHVPDHSLPSSSNGSENCGCSGDIVARLACQSCCTSTIGGLVLALVNRFGGDTVGVGDASVPALLVVMQGIMLLAHARQRVALLPLLQHAQPGASISPQCTRAALANATDAYATLISSTSVDDGDDVESSVATLRAAITRIAASRDELRMAVHMGACGGTVLISCRSLGSLALSILLEKHRYALCAALEQADHRRCRLGTREVVLDSPVGVNHKAFLDGALAGMYAEDSFEYVYDLAASTTLLQVACEQAAPLLTEDGMAVLFGTLRDAAWKALSTAFPGVTAAVDIVNTMQSGSNYETASGARPRLYDAVEAAGRSSSVKDVLDASEGHRRGLSDIVTVAGGTRTSTRTATNMSSGSSSNAGPSLSSTTVDHAATLRLGSRGEHSGRGTSEDVTDLSPYTSPRTKDAGSLYQYQPAQGSRSSASHLQPHFARFGVPVPDHSGGRAIATPSPSIGLETAGSRDITLAMPLPARPVPRIDMHRMARSSGRILGAARTNADGAADSSVHNPGVSSLPSRRTIGSHSSPKSDLGMSPMASRPRVSVVVVGEAATGTQVPVVVTAVMRAATIGVIYALETLNPAEATAMKARADSAGQPPHVDSGLVTSGRDSESRHHTPLALLRAGVACALLSSGRAWVNLALASASGVRCTSFQCPLCSPRATIAASAAIAHSAALVSRAFQLIDGQLSSEGRDSIAQFLAFLEAASDGVAPATVPASVAAVATGTASMPTVRWENEGDGRLSTAVGYRHHSRTASRGATWFDGAHVPSRRSRVSGVSGVVTSRAAQGSSVSGTELAQQLASAVAIDATMRALSRTGEVTSAVAALSEHWCVSGCAARLLFAVSDAVKMPRQPVVPPGIPPKMSDAPAHARPSVVRPRTSRTYVSMLASAALLSGLSIAWPSAVAGGEAALSVALRFAFAWQRMFGAAAELAASFPGDSAELAHVSTVPSISYVVDEHHLVQFTAAEAAQVPVPMSVGAAQLTKAMGVLLMQLRATFRQTTVHVQQLPRAVLGSVVCRPASPLGPIFASPTSQLGLRAAAEVLARSVITSLAAVVPAIAQSETRQGVYDGNDSAFIDRLVCLESIVSLGGRGFENAQRRETSSKSPLLRAVAGDFTGSSTPGSTVSVALLSRITAASAMSDAIVSSGLLTALCRALSLEARARVTWMRRQEQDEQVSATLPAARVATVTLAPAALLSVDRRERSDGANSATPTSRSITAAQPQLDTRAISLMKFPAATQLLPGNSKRIEVDPKTGMPLRQSVRVVSMDVNTTEPATASLTPVSKPPGRGALPPLPALTSVTEPGDKRTLPIELLPQRGNMHVGSSASDSLTTPDKLLYRRATHAIGEGKDSLLSIARGFSAGMSADGTPGSGVRMSPLAIPSLQLPMGVRKGSAHSFSMLSPSPNNARFSRASVTPQVTPLHMPSRMSQARYTVQMERAGRVVVSSAEPPSWRESRGVNGAVTPIVRHSSSADTSNRAPAITLSARGGITSGTGVHGRAGALHQIRTPAIRNAVDDIGLVSPTTLTSSSRLMRQLGVNSGAVGPITPASGRRHSTTGSPSLEKRSAARKLQEQVKSAKKAADITPLSLVRTMVSKGLTTPTPTAAAMPRAIVARANVGILPSLALPGRASLCRREDRGEIVPDQDLMRTRSRSSSSSFSSSGNTDDGANVTRLRSDTYVSTTSGSDGAPSAAVVSRARLPRHGATELVAAAKQKRAAKRGDGVANRHSQSHDKALARFANVALPQRGWTEVDDLDVAFRVSQLSSGGRSAFPAPPVSYMEARLASPLYVQDREIMHAHVVALLLACLLTPEGVALRDKVAARTARHATSHTSATPRVGVDNVRAWADSPFDPERAGGDSIDSGSVSEDEVAENHTSPVQIAVSVPVPAASTSSSVESHSIHSVTVLNSVSSVRDDAREAMDAIGVAAVTGLAAGSLSPMQQLDVSRVTSAAASSVRGETWEGLDVQPVLVLQSHLNHPGNVSLANAAVRNLCHTRGRHYVRLLRLICVECFQTGYYERQDHIASGAYGTVVSAIARRESPAVETLLRLQQGARVEDRDRDLQLSPHVLQTSALPPHSTATTPAAPNAVSGVAPDTPPMVVRPASTQSPTTGKAFLPPLRIPQPVKSQFIAAREITGSSGDVAAAQFRVAIKIVTFPDNPTERCVLADVLPEVAILEDMTADHIAILEDRSDNATAQLQHQRAAGCPVVGLLDYGVTATECWSVMERCSSSLAQWRQDSLSSLLKLDSCASALLLLDIYACVVERVSTLHAAGVVHYDLKCDNVLLRDGFAVAAAAALESCRASEVRVAGGPAARSRSSLWPSWRSLLPFICIADFGESEFLPSCPASERPFIAGRGTECIKAPELLRAATSARTPFPDALVPASLRSVAQDATTLSARGSPTLPPSSSAAACDVWSIGCLLYELLSGRLLFHDAADDWARFYLTVTGDTTLLPQRGGNNLRTDGSAPLPLLAPEKVELVRDGLCKGGTALRLDKRLATDEATPAPYAAELDATVRVLLDLLLAVLVRDPLQRPSVSRVAALVCQARDAVRAAWASSASS